MAKWLNERRKTIAALVTGIIGWVTAYNVAEPKWVALATVIAMALGVYIVPNQQPQADE